MISFHDLLTRHIEEKSISVPNMASYCGLERSSLYRIIRGQRVPADETVVHQMASYLCLSPAEEEDFLLSYYVETVGYEKFERRNYLDSFLRNFHTTSVENDLYSYEITHNTTKEVLATPMTSKTDVIRAFSSIITAEATLPAGGYVRMFAPPAPEFISILHGATKSLEHPLKLDHLIQLRQKDNSSEASNQNLKSILETLNLTCSNIEYHPRYFYSEVIPRLPMFMPYQVFASDSLFWVAEDLSSGLLIQHPTILPHMIKQFDTSFASCRILYEPSKENEMVVVWEDHMKGSGDPHRVGKLIPFPPLTLTKDGARAHIQEEYLETNSLLSLLPDKLSDDLSFLETYYSILIMSELGIDRFAQSGIIPRFSAAQKSPLTKEERIDVLRLILQLADRIPLRFLKRDLTNVHDGLSVSVDADHCCLEIFSEDDSSTFLMIQEPNIVSSMQDYVYSMNERDLFSEEESKQILQKILARLINEAD